MKITGLILGLLLVLSSCGSPVLEELSRKDTRMISKLNKLAEGEMTKISFHDEHGGIQDVEAYDLHIAQDSTLWSDLMNERRSAIPTARLISVEITTDEGATLRGGMIGALVGLVGTLAIALAINDGPIDGSITGTLATVSLLTALPGLVIGALQTSTTIYYLKD